MFNLSDGFDFVIGNPPYVQLQKFKGKDIQTVYKNQNYQTYEATGDLYCLFYEKGIELLKDGGILCYITSNKWMRAGYGESLRSYFIKYNPTLLIDLGANVFTSATVDTNILLVEKKGYDKKTLSCTLRDRSQEMSVFVRQNAIAMEYTKDAWAILNPIEQSIKAKIEKYGTPLKDWDVSIYRGVLTGCNEAFIISGEKRKELIAEDPKSDEIIRPILRGRDIKRYGYEFADLWLINIECGFTNKYRGNKQPEEFIKTKYPAIYNHFMKVASAKTKGKGLINRDDKGDYWWELRSCAYTNDFSKQKIVWSDIATEPTFALIEIEIYFNNTCYMLCNAPKYILPILNSPLLGWYFRKIATDLGSGQRYFKQFVELLPVIQINDDTCISLLEKKTECNQYQYICNLYQLTETEINYIMGS